MIDGAMNAKMFDRYITTQLVPTLKKGDVVILDNLSSHKSPGAARTLRQVGAWFLFLPPYSPDLNPPSRDIAAQCTVGQRSKWRSQSSRRCSERQPREHTMTFGRRQATCATEVARFV